MNARAALALTILAMGTSCVTSGNIKLAGITSLQARIPAGREHDLARSAAKSLDDRANEVITLVCQPNIASKSRDNSVNRGLSIAGIVVGGAGMTVSGVGAVLSSDDAKTTVAISSAVVSGLAAVLSGVQLVYRPAESSDVVEIGRKIDLVEALVLDAATINDKLTVALRATAGQSDVVRAAQKALDDKAKSQPAPTPDDMKPFQEILVREKSLFESLSSTQRAAEQAYSETLDRANTAIDALRAKCNALN